MSRIAIILTPGFADWEYAYVAGTGGPFYGMEIAFFTPSPGDVISQGGLTARITHSVSEIGEWKPNVLVVIGGLGWDGSEPPDVSEALIGQRGRGGTVAGICGGTLALARSGLLDGVRHTSNGLGFLVDNAPNYTGADRYVESPTAIADDGIITAPGTAATGFAAAVFEAAGMERETANGFRAMVAAEHRER